MPAPLFPATETPVPVQADDVTIPVHVLTGGSAGGPAPIANEQVTLTAGADLSGHKVVRATGTDHVDYASSDDPAHIGSAIGVTYGAAAAGTPIAVVTSGPIVEPTWSWTPGPVFLGINGALTQTAPTSGFVQTVGVATSPTRLIVEIGMAILRA